MISIVVPIYNGEKYINKCVKSVLKQNYDDFELILVDDGSTDSSLELAYRIAKTDCRIRVFTQKNQGPVMARRTGMMNAAGEWITFLDIDDTFARKDLLEILSKTIKENNADLIQFGNYHTYFYGLIKRKQTQPRKSIKVKEFEKDVYIDLFGGMPTYLTPTVWGKVYPTKQLKTVLEPVDIRIYMGDDMYINNLYFEKYKPSKFEILDLAGINHGIGIGISVNNILRNWNDYVNLKNLQIDIIERNHLPEQYTYSCYVELVYLLYYTAIQVLENGNDEKQTKQLIKDAFELKLIRNAKEYLSKTTLPKWELIDEFCTFSLEKYYSTIENNLQSRTTKEKIVRKIKSILYR